MPGTMPTDTPATTIATTIQPLSDGVLAKLMSLNKQLPSAFQGIAPIYAAPVVRMIQDNSIADVSALYAKLKGLTTPAALDVIHANMTGEELVAEKQQLTPLFLKMANDSYEAQVLGQKILQAALSAGISLALMAAGF